LELQLWFIARRAALLQLLTQAQNSRQSWECHLRVKAQLGLQNTRVNISILWSYICVQMNRFPWSPAQEGLLTRVML
jgi:hypothetical protein